MSVLTNQGFDRAVAAAATPLQGILEPRRKAGLASIQKTLQGANLGALGRGQLAGFALGMQEPLLTQASDAPAVSKQASSDQAKIAVAARKEAKATWKIDASESFAEGDPRLESIQANTAGLFAIERDRALAARVAERFASAVQENKAGLDLFSIFAGAWGESAEKGYWTLVAAAWLGKSRNYGIAELFKDAGLVWCRVAAQIDERTSHICRFLHQKRVLVSSVVLQEGLDLTPRSTSNWITETPPPELDGLNIDLSVSKPLLLMPPKAPGEKGKPLALRTERHALGTGSFDMGKYDQFVSDDELSRTLGPPPYHFLCRSMLVPDDWKDPLNLKAITEQKPVPTGL